jgi:hypothetical protein
MTDVHNVSYKLTTGEAYTFPVAGPAPFVVARYLWCWEGELLIQAQAAEPVEPEQVDLAQEALEKHWCIFTDWADGNSKVSDLAFTQALELYHATMDALYRLGDI